MNKIMVIALALILGFVGLAYSRPYKSVNTAIAFSSYTATADTEVEISSNTHVFTLFSVAVTSPSAGTLTLYDARQNAVAYDPYVIGKVDLNERGCYNFSVALSSGLTYTTTGTGWQLTMTYNADNE